MKKIVFVLISAFFFNCSSTSKSKKNEEAIDNNSPDIILDIKKIGLKNLKEIELVLGNGVLLENVKIGDKKYPKYGFNDDAVEIVFIEDKADWITINDMKSTKFENCSIDKLGDFNCINRDFKSDEVMRWNNVNGFNEIAFFRKWDNGKMTAYIDYAHIKVASK